MQRLNKKRVVITGMGAVSPFGQGVDALCHNLWQGQCALQNLEGKIESIDSLGSFVGGLVENVSVKSIPRDVRRTMSSMSAYATLASLEALEQAQIIVDGNKDNLPPMGVSIGSTLGSPAALYDFFHEYITTRTLDSIRATTFFKVMSHSVASNVAMALGLRGRLLAPAAACASGLVSLGMAYENIAYGQEERMLAGGADEFHVLTAATFDKMQAASLEKNPMQASLPFDTRRSGVIVSEGVGILFVESLDSALARKAPILAEIKGYASTTSPYSIAHPDIEGMQECMQKTLHDSALTPQDIGYINAHATATKAGDVAEGKAIEALFGKEAVPVSSLKGHLGHTMGASGSIESIACIRMLHKAELLPTLHLHEPDLACGYIDHITHVRPQNMRYCMKNSFAMGGVYSSMIFAKFED